jgi:hypothetical protein
MGFLPVMSRKRRSPSPGTTGKTVSRKPAFGAYLRVPAGDRPATILITITLAGDRICATSRFEASVLPWFGLPPSLPNH